MSPLVPLPPVLFDRFEAAGFARAEPAVLQPADPFLHVMGEELRARMFLTTDADGAELCLRPDFTIPTALDHIAGGDPARAASYFYGGPVFRQGADGAARAEIAQAGVESFGRADLLAAETEILALALEASAALGVAEPAIRIGDVGLTAAAVDALDAPVAFRRRLRREIAQGAIGVAPSQPTRVGHAGLVAALDAVGPEAARAVVEDLLSLAGIATVGGRTAAEIAERFLEQTAAAAAPALPDGQRAAFEAFLAIDDGAEAALARLKTLADGGLAIGAATQTFEARLAAFAQAGLPIGRMRFSSRFGRKLDYYTGLVFELGRPEGGDPLAGGGRYDGLLQALGAPGPAPGVGFSLWLDRFPGRPR